MFNILYELICMDKEKDKVSCMEKQCTYDAFSLKRGIKRIIKNNLITFVKM